MRYQITIVKVFSSTEVISPISRVSHDKTSFLESIICGVGEGKGVIQPKNLKVY